MRPAPTVNRLARIERGRRTELQQGKKLVLPSGTSDGERKTERNRRSEEYIVAEWFDATDEAAPDAVMAASSVRWPRGWDVPGPLVPVGSHISS
jgi:hypothetical protein